MAKKSTKMLPKLHPMAKELYKLIQKREALDDDILDIVLKLQDRTKMADALGSLTLTVEREESDGGT